MAKIPTLQESQRIRPSNPTGFQSAAAARLRGESLAGLGRGVAALGTKLDRVQRRQKAAEARIAQQDFKNQMSRDLQDLNEQITLRGGTGDDDKEFYDQKSSELLNRNLKAFDKKYGGKYGSSFNVAGNDLINGVRRGVIANGLERQKNFLAQSVEQTTSVLNAQAYQNPEAIDELTTDYTTTIGGTMLDMEANPEQVKAATFSGHRALVDSAIDGHIEKGNYKEASNLVLNRYPHLYNTKDQAAALKEIRDAKLSAVSLRQKEEDRRQKQIDEAVKATQLENAANARAALFKATNPRTIQKVKDQIIEMAKVGDLAYTQFGGLLNDTIKADKEVSALGSYDISQKVYNAETPEDLEKVRQTLYNLEKTGRIDPRTAERWERTIHQMKKTGKNNPLSRPRAKVFRNKLLEFTKPMDFLAKTLDQFNGQIALKRKVQTESQYDQMVLNGVDPQIAFAKSVNDNYPGVEGLSLFPGYSKIPKTRQDIQEFYNWGRTSLGTHQVPAFKSYLNELETALSREDIIKALQTTQIEGAEKQSVQFIDDFLNLDELTKPRGDELPLIFRR